MSLKFKNEQEFQEWLNGRGGTCENTRKKEKQEESIVIYIPITVVLLVILVFSVLFFLGKV